MTIETQGQPMVLLGHVFDGDHCPNCTGGYEAMAEALRVTAHIPELDIRAKYIVSDLWIRGWDVRSLQVPAPVPIAAPAPETD